MKELLIVWILATITSMSPPDRNHFIPEASESMAQANARYREIARDIVETVYREDVKPVFSGSYGRERTAMLVASIFWMESGFRRDVDLGIGRARTRRAGLNDFGRSWCMGQINLGRHASSDTAGEERSAALTVEGWTGQELIQDRTKCVVATVNKLRSSFGECRHLPPRHRLAAYAAGKCDSEAGKFASSIRFEAFQRYFEKNRPKVKDLEVLEEIKAENEAKTDSTLAKEDAESPPAL